MLCGCAPASHCKGVPRSFGFARVNGVSGAPERGDRKIQIVLGDQQIVGVVRRNHKKTHASLGERAGEGGENAGERKVQWTFHAEESPPALRGDASGQTRLFTTARNLIVRVSDGNKGRAVAKLRPNE